jgi:hypothetical protein
MLLTVVLPKGVANPLLGRLLIVYLLVDVMPMAIYFTNIVVRSMHDVDMNEQEFASL